MKKNRYHFIGVGGISMSALAQMLKANGNVVTGTDIKKVHLPGIDCSAKNKVRNLKKANVIVASSAIKNNDKQILLAKKLGKKILTRANLLGEISKGYQNVIAISGTHGKTTTTEMIAEIFLEAGKNPTIHLGGVSKKFGSNFLLGGQEFFITEACEFANSFLTLKPTVGVITNIEEEHLDFFQTFQNEKKSFQKFANNCEIIINNSKIKLKNKKIIKNKLKNNYFNENKLNFNKKYYFQNIQKKSFGYSFDVFENKKFCFAVELNSLVKENIDNAILAITVCKIFGIEDVVIQTALKNFCGVKRRMEVVSTSPFIFHDYAHHPTEILSAINAVKNFYDKKLVVFFQPHTYSRTKTLMENFVKVLSLCDEVYILKTYPAREKFDKQGSAKTLFELLRKNKKNVHYFSSMKKCENILKTLPSTSIALVLGAGDVNQIVCECKE